MSRASVLARAQAFAAGGFVDSCTITRVTGHTTDPDTGVQTPTEATIYTGPCRVQQQAAANARPADVGEDYQLLLRLEVQLPATVTGVEVADTVTITAAAHDADLVDRVFRVRELAHKTHLSARRIGVEEVTF